MALRKTFGKLCYEKETRRWVLSDVEPHVCIKLKNVFPSIPKYEIAPFSLPCTEETAADLSWFFERYPFEADTSIVRKMSLLKKSFDKNANEIEAIISGRGQVLNPELKENMAPRGYQLVASSIYDKAKRMLLGDDIGLGKTLSAILTLLSGKKVPALIVVQTHLTRQWEEEIAKFTHLTTHILKGTRPYQIPEANVYIIKYSCLTGWIDYLSKFGLRSIIFDEIQELRRSESNKYMAAAALAGTVEYCLGLSATPVYNYGEEIFNIMSVIKKDCLGSREEFLREWGGGYRAQNRLINDPAALGSYLRERHLFLRRTRTEVGRELPILNKIVHTVGYNEDDVQKSEDLARQLSMKVLSGSFTERGQAARELDILVRLQTGVSKAKEVAAYVKILLDNNEPVVLAGWHREVYRLWEKELAEYNPVFYTGTESEKEKVEAKEKFISGKTNLFIISLRSGIGLDGLQHRCRTVVIGELDWSPQVHAQVVGRVDRDGQQFQVSVIYLVSEYGSDPLIIDLLGLKSSQSHGILNPMCRFSITFRLKGLKKDFRTASILDFSLTKNDQPVFLSN
jgi:SNF2 family DNA or RNA helicase